MEKNSQGSEEVEKDRAVRRRRTGWKRRRQREMVLKAAGCMALLAVIVGFTLFVSNALGVGEEGKKDSGQKEQMTETVTAAVTESEDGKSAVLEEAAYLAAGYDYDGATDLLKQSDYAEDDAVVTAISEYERQKGECVAVDIDTIPHISYQSLVNEPGVTFSASAVGEDQASIFNSTMITVEEFDQITQQMYDNGYVFVRMRDLVTETTDENGNTVFRRNTELMLPPDKKAVVLSVDDLNYYHEYEGAGFPDKLVLDDNGDVKCHYVTTEGTEQVGDFDVVPRLNTFLDQHPDGAYRGARGTISLTGSEGVFGYRTDTAYQTGENLSEAQSLWLQQHTDFNWEKEVADATKVAEALKESGWEFASHTWGRIDVDSESVEALKEDHEKWVQTVQNIVGETDTMLFAQNQDIGDWHDYSSDNSKFQYYKEAGFDFYGNIDASVPYWVQVRDHYVRQGRINLDGYTLYRISQGQLDVTEDMFAIDTVFDTTRPTPIAAAGN